MHEYITVKKQISFPMPLPKASLRGYLESKNGRGFCVETSRINIYKLEIKNI